MKIRSLFASSVLAAACAVALGAAPAHAIVDGDVVPGGWQGDPVPATNPYGFVGRMSIGCTASLVAPTVALTAAHCAGATGSTVTFGELNAHRDGGEVRTVTGTSDLGDTWTPGASILVMRLDRPVTTIAPVRLAGPGDSGLWSGGKTLTGLGWGSIVDQCPGSPQIPSAELRSADLRIVDTAVSVGVYRNTAKVRSVAGHPAKGDSGGPLIARDAAGQPVQVGVYQATVGACGREYASYYNRIWTQKKLREFVEAELA
ncbi:trypsin-like serine protease [Actinoplanes sp. LDG1-06]|uniref:Trypsin-like serine protease n=1 Tax=Paractinoplanes ovalisporus TaxID=2810368 RepID=A0ABS2A6W0_9ACTN|nr:trypsin-like serine protease [Actinoplanes ovalisporus]MBM2615053.1 trypsin-like serine protease [Actinoplanes ovalisporus]